MLFELRVAVGGEHFAVRVDVYALAVGLLQKQLEVAQIMAADDDEGAFFDREGNGCRNRCAEGFGVRLVQKRHRRKVSLAHLQDDRQELFHAPVLADGKERLGKETADFFVLIAEHERVVRVGGHAADAEENEGLEASDVLLRRPELLHVVVGIVAAGALTVAAIRDKAGGFCVNIIREALDVLGAEIDVRERCKKGACHEMPGVLRDLLVSVRRPGKADERAGERVLQICNICRLTAYAAVPRAAGAVRCLLALIAKHSLHDETLLIFSVSLFADSV